MRTADAGWLTPPNPFVWSLRALRYPYGRAVAELRKIKALDREAHRAWLEQARWVIAEHHFQKNPLYRQLVGSRLPSRWSELPIVNKGQLRGNLAQCLTQGYSPETCYVGKTSGSSGKPLVFAKDRFCHALTWANIYDLYAEHGIYYGVSKQARFYAAPLAKWNALAERVKDCLAARDRFVIHNMSEPILEGFVKRFQRGDFEYLYGYSNSLILFAKYLHARGVKLSHVCPTLRACMVTAEVCTETDRAFLAEAFGVRIINEYGSSEFGVIALDTLNERWKLNQRDLFIESVDPNGRPTKDGEAGRIVITALFNRAMPLVRYELGDHGRLSEDATRLASVDGRLNDTLSLPTGRVVPGFTLYYVTKDLMSTMPQIREYAIKQLSDVHLQFEVVLDRPLRDSATSDIQKLVDRYVGEGLVVSVCSVDAIERSDNGKLKHFQNLTAANRGSTAAKNSSESDSRAAPA